MTIYDEIRAERVRQDYQWGGPEHDDLHDECDWMMFVSEFADGDRGKTFRSRLVAIAALAVAAIEAHDRRQTP